MHKASILNGETSVTRIVLAGLLLSLGVVLPMQQAAAFKFSDEDGQKKAEESAKAQRVADLLSVNCREQLKGKKTVVLIGEEVSGGISARQGKYGALFQAINRRLTGLGFKTYSAEEIRQQIAQAEIDAYFRNDPDAALAASRKLSAQFTLRGLISARTGVNPVLKINEVAVTMMFTLTDSAGKTISSVSANSESYAGTDTLGMALTLIEEQADEVVARMYSDYCRNTRKK